MSYPIIVYGLILVLLAVWIIAWAEIMVKTGFNRWLCFLMVVPIINIFFVIWFAYKKWPVYEFVEKGWDVKRLVIRKKELEQQIAELEGRPLQSEEREPKEEQETIQGVPLSQMDIINKQKQKDHVKIRTNIVRVGIAVVVICLSIGWYVSWVTEHNFAVEQMVSNGDLQRKLIIVKEQVQNQDDKLSNLTKEYANSTSEYEETINKLNSEIELLQGRLSTAASDVELAGKLALELSGVRLKYSSALLELETLRVSYDNLSKVYPPKEFSSRDELRTWISANLTEKTLFPKLFMGPEALAKALELQKKALSEGFIVSVGLSQSYPNYQQSMQYVYLWANIKDSYPLLWFVDNDSVEYLPPR